MNKKESGGRCWSGAGNTVPKPVHRTLHTDAGGRFLKVRAVNDYAEKAPAARSGGRVCCQLHASAQFGECTVGGGGGRGRRQMRTGSRCCEREDARFRMGR
jgi:hypothetical protein